MRKITIELYANNEYTLSERLKEIDRSISNTVWPSRIMFNLEGTKAKKASGCIEEEKQYLLTDYEHEKEDPTWSTGGNTVCTGKWKMQVVPDEEYFKFQRSEEL